MKKLPPPITKKTFEQETSKWLKVIASGESGCILFFPKQDRHRRIPQLLKDRVLLKKHLKQPNNYLFLCLDIDIFPIEEIEDLEEYLTDQLNTIHERDYATFSQWLKFLNREGMQLVIFSVNAEKLLIKEYRPILFLLAKMAEDNSCVQILLFFDRDITHPEYFDFVSTRTILFQNLLFYPLYKRGDVEQFISYLEIKWTLDIPKNIRQEIVKHCGGHFWLVKEAVRHYRYSKDTKKIFTHEDINLRLEGIYNRFLNSERSLLRKIVFGRKTFDEREKHSLKYLKRMNLIDRKEKITIPLLAEYVKGIKSKKSTVAIKNGNVLLNNVPVDAFFSKKELRVFKELVKRKGKLIKRDEIAELIWPENTEDKYSDWAIDQIVARIRERLIKLYIPPKALKTVRGRGYRFSVNDTGT